MKKTTRGKPIELAYIAGFVDGEGCIGIYKRNYPNKPNWAPRYYTQVFIVNTDKNILKWIETFFVGTMHKKKKYNIKHRQGFVFYIRGNETPLFLKAILPYLKIKKEQAKLVLDFHQKIKKVKGAFGRQMLDEKEIKKREQFYQKSLKLNSCSRND